MTDKPKDPQEPSGRPRRSSHDALDRDGHVNPEKLAENQRKLNVGSDHKTPDMKKRHRGTFP
jgi:hypothetical protein